MSNAWRSVSSNLTSAASTPTSYTPTFEKFMSRTKNQLQSIVEEIDEIFGDGYAKKNPELIGRVFQGEKPEDAAKSIRDALEREQ